MDGTIARKPGLTAGVMSCVLMLLTMSVSAQENILGLEGFYIGVHGGYAWGEGDAEAAGTPTVEGDGGFGGVQVGYDFETSGNLVIGIVADVSAGDINGSELDGSLLRFTGETDYLGTVRLRLAYAFEQFLPYITGGFAWSHNEATMSCPAGATAGFCLAAGQFSSTDELFTTGWTIGGGVEVDFSDHWSATAEYLYADFGTNTITFNTPLGTASGGSEQTLNRLLLGVNYHF